MHDTDAPTVVWDGWIEGPCADNVRRLRFRALIYSDNTVEIVEVEDTTDWQATQ